MGNEVRSEFDLYEPMRQWLEQRLQAQHPSSEVIAVDAHSERLDRVLQRYGIVNQLANGVDIQIDVLGIVRDGSDYRLFFIEAKKTNLTLRDLGQLWAYCRLIDPAESYLLSSAGLGSLNKLLRMFSREDLLNFGDQKHIKMMQVGLWDPTRNMPDSSTMVPKII